MPNAVIYGPLEYGGMEMVESYSLQDQIQMTNLMTHLRWGQTGANDILVTLDNIQLASGFVRPVWEETGRQLDYIDQGWLVSMQKMLGEIDSSL